jgi:hypothetical protein
MQRLEVSGAVRHIYMSLGVKGLIYMCLFAQASGRETRVHAGRWHAGRSLTLFSGTQTLHSVSVSIARCHSHKNKRLIIHFAGTARELRHRE